MGTGDIKGIVDAAAPDAKIGESAAIDVDKGKDGSPGVAVAKGKPGQDAIGVGKGWFIYFYINYLFYLYY